MIVSVNDSCAAPPANSVVQQQVQVQVQVSVQLIGRIARKMKRKRGIELAIRAERINGAEDPPPKLPPIVVCILKSDTATMVKHPVFVQLNALVRVIYVEDACADQGPTVWSSRCVTQLELLECPGEPQAVQAILKEPSLWYSLKPRQQSATNGSDDDELEEDELDYRAKNQHYLVRQIIARLQRRKLETPRERPPVVRYRTLQALEELEKEIDLVEIKESNNNQQEEQDEDLLVCLPIGTTTTTAAGEEQDHHDWNLPENGKIIMKSNHHKLTRQEYLQRKKYPQIRWLLARLKQLYSRWPFRHVLDVGGGRGDLAIQVARMFPQCHVTVIDLNKTSLEAGKAFANKQQQQGGKQGGDVADRMHWICQDFRDYLQQQQQRQSQSRLPETESSATSTTTEQQQQQQEQAIAIPDIDLVIAWHACGDLSDMAIQIGLHHGAAMVICPCCYSKLIKQTVATQLAELQNRPDLSRRGMHVVNSHRYQYIVNNNNNHNQQQQQGLRVNNNNNSNNYNVSLEEYSREWSGRNQVLIAYPNKTTKKC